MLDLGMLYFNSDPRLATPDVLDPFVITKNPQRLGDRLVDAAGAYLRRVFHALEIDAGNFARLQGHTYDLPYFAFLSPEIQLPRGALRPLAGKGRSGNSEKCDGCFVVIEFRIELRDRRLPG